MHFFQSFGISRRLCSKLLYFFIKASPIEISLCANTWCPTGLLENRQLRQILLAIQIPLEFLLEYYTVSVDKRSSISEGVTEKVPGFDEEFLLSLIIRYGQLV